MHDVSSVAFCTDELEAMLKDQNSPAPDKSSASNLSPDSASSLPDYAGLADTTISSPSSSFHLPNLGLQQDYEPSSFTFNTGVTPSLKSFISPVDIQPAVVKIPAAATISEIQGDSTPFLSHGFGYDVLWPAWPRDLPSPSLVRHL